MSKRKQADQAVEVRAGIPAEFRSEGETIKVSGYAAVFGEQTDIGGYWKEVIQRGAFKDAIGRDDVFFLINHEGLPLARTKSGTLTLQEDDHGLFIESELDENDPDVQSIIPKMKRGDLDKMSFAFWADIQEWDESGDIPVRTIVQASLYDVSIVTRPAYDGTEIGLRSLDAHRKSEKTGNYEAAQKRLARKVNLDLRQRAKR